MVAQSVFSYIIVFLAAETLVRVAPNTLHIAILEVHQLRLNPPSGDHVKRHRRFVLELEVEGISVVIVLEVLALNGAQTERIPS